MNPIIHPSNNPVSLADLELQARKLREARDEVAAIVTDLNNFISQLQREASRKLKSVVAKTADRHSELKNLVEANRHAFVKPRTYTFHGICFGIEKGKGKIEFETEQEVIDNCEKKFPELLDTLAPATRSVSKTALKLQPADTLRKLGCTVEETGDRIIVRYTDKEVDKLVNALLKSATAEAQAEAA